MNYKLRVTDGTYFDLNRIFCVGRNYLNHAHEMGHTSPEPPFFFMKPNSALLRDNSEFVMPSFSNLVHYEVELVIAIKGAVSPDPNSISSSIFGVGIGLDMTARDIQQEAKRLGRPWDISKGFSGAAICSDIMPLKLEEILKLSKFYLKKNNRVVQEGSIDEMILSIPELISELSRLIPLSSGDLIYTGTPSGVGKVSPGDILQAYIDDVNLSKKFRVSQS